MARWLPSMIRRAALFGGRRRQRRGIAYDLPDSLVAVHPADPRDSSRLLSVVPPPSKAGGRAGRVTLRENLRRIMPSRGSDGGSAAAADGLLLGDFRFRDLLPRLLPATGCHIVMNSSKVLSARLSVAAADSEETDDDSNFEMLLLSPADAAADPDSLMTHPARGQTWRCMLRSDALGVGDRLKLLRVDHDNLSGDDVCARITAVHQSWLEDGEDDGVEADVMFEEDNDQVKVNPTTLNMDTLLRAYGAIPIPPYLNRDAVSSDATTYQTVYADKQGSVAAPTAGLHFSDKIMAELRGDLSRFTVSDVTLHVGAGTFKPVVGEIEDHEMHRESFDIELNELNALIASLSKNIPIVAVGTTSVRVLESLYWMGARRLLRDDDDMHDEIVQTQISSPPPPANLGQWEPGEIVKAYAAVHRALPSAANALASLSPSSSNGIILRGTTEICIAQDYTFQILDGLVTNFHQSKSTLMHLTAAVVGGEDCLRECYAHAIREEYRFLSYGDACFMVLA